MAGPASIRHANALTCIHVLRTAIGALSISDVVQRTGLSRPTVDSVMAAFEERNLVSAAASDAVTASGGRPARRFLFEANSSVVAGVDAGSRNIKVLIANLQGCILGQAHRRIMASISAVQRVDAVIETIRDALAAADVPASKLRVACIGVPGIVGFDGRISNSYIVPEWNGTDVAKRIGAAFDCHAFLENDINLAAFAEHHLGASQLVENTLYLQVGNTISLSLTFNGKIHQGFHRSAGEVGSLRGMRWTGSSVDGLLSWTSAPTAVQVFDQAQSGDNVSLEEIKQLTRDIAPRIATISLAFDPDLIVVGGGLSRSGEFFVELLREEIHRLIMIDAKPTLAASALGADGTTYGAVALVFHKSATELFGMGDVPVPEISFSENRF
ncbi:Sugar kinase of the NBD/HSP70 family, may contain an N-terminal HTH domain [Arthrobacter alpinus]|uniref:Sugar kinase of the NBD/HSP70 family, may contain an N-terminal HTH domain n=2 Tax=Arthrobacter alpinus TaxID=656366 RepID=A0A1H5PI32_9MICC|nr:Sugar kinase of the NBD/HSP70 family, may contain an N-terminal HTH domain [Arthrobacter alpinus]